MAPFGIQVVIYLFLAGLAGGIAYFAALALTAGRPDSFSGGRRAVVLALLCAVLGAVFLVFDLTRPGEFLLILTQANAGSAISWGARILVVFILSTLFVCVAVRRWDETEIKQGFQGGDRVALYVMVLSALGLAIYPFFVLRQGEAYPLWQNWFLLPLITFSAFHAGVAGMLLVTRGAEARRRARPLEIGLGSVQIALLVLVFSLEGASAVIWVVALAVGTLVPLLLALSKPKVAVYARVALVLLGTFTIRYWMITAGQTT